MPLQFFTYKNGQQCGPFNEAEILAQIQTATIGCDELIWREGDANWTPANKLFAGILPPELPAKPKHSRMGIASFILGLVSVGLILIFVLVAGIIGVIRPGILEDENAPPTLILGVFGMFALMLAILGFGMALASLLIEKNNKKTFSILGLIFSLLTAISMITMIVIGLLSR